MSYTYTAIIHLDNPTRGRAAGEGVLSSLLRVIRGVQYVSYEPTDSLITVRFDDQLTSLAELVRTIEDAGSPVSSVAQRPAP